MSIGTGRLIRGGYVTSERDPKDARRLQLRLTDAGERVRRQQSVLDMRLVEGLRGWRFWLVRRRR